jgi:hypothetical protein
MKRWSHCSWIREKPLQPVVIRQPSAGIRGRSPCNLAKSPCIPPNCRQRRVGSGLPAQPPSREFFGSLPRRSECLARSPELRHRIAIAPLTRRQRARFGAPLPAISTGHFRGSHLRVRPRLHHQRSIMMCSYASSSAFSCPRPAVGDDGLACFSDEPRLTRGNQVVRCASASKNRSATQERSTGASRGSFAQDQATLWTRRTCPLEGRGQKSTPCAGEKAQPSLGAHF